MAALQVVGTIHLRLGAGSELGPVRPLLEARMSMRLLGSMRMDLLLRMVML